MMRVRRRSIVLFLINALLVLGTGAAAVQVYRNLMAPVPLPPSPSPPGQKMEAQASQSASRADARKDPTAYTSIVVRNPFSPTRSEIAAASATPSPPVPKPILHGVLLDGSRSRAYLEDPITKRVAGYAQGDSIAGGRLDKIDLDRVVIARPEGMVEVSVNDPAKPRPVSPSQPQAGIQRTAVVSPAATPPPLMPTLSAGPRAFPPAPPPRPRP
jgi:hypothetical protein